MAFVTLGTTPHSILIEATPLDGSVVAQSLTTQQLVSAMAEGPLKVWFNKTYKNGGTGSSADLTPYNPSVSNPLSAKIRVMSHAQPTGDIQGGVVFTATGLEVNGASLQGAREGDSAPARFEIRFLHSQHR